MLSLGLSSRFCLWQVLAAGKRTTRCCCHACCFLWDLPGKCQQSPARCRGRFGWPGNILKGVGSIEGQLTAACGVLVLHSLCPLMASTCKNLSNQCAACNWFGTSTVRWLPVQQLPRFIQVGLNEPVQPTLRWQPRKESIYAVAISDDGVLCAAGSTANMVQASRSCVACAASQSKGLLARGAQTAQVLSACGCC